MLSTLAKNLDPVPTPRQENPGSRKRKREIESGDIFSDTKRAKAESAHFGVELSQSQEQVIERIMSGKNIVYSGAAGTGKTFVTNMAKDMIIAASGLESILLTAHTATAALNLGNANTLYSTLCIPVGRNPSINGCMKSLRTSGKLEVITIASVMVIDEISAISLDLLEFVDQLLRTARNNREPFGGMQMVLVGDFMQLPPISDDKTVAAKYAFQSSLFDAVFGSPIMLTVPFRQANGPFLEILERVRMGKAVKADEAYLNTHCYLKGGARKSENAIFMGTHVKDVMAENERRSRKLTTPIKVYTCVDVGPKIETDKLDKNSPLERRISMRVGARVMQTVNIRNKDESAKILHANGSMGTVVSLGPNAVEVQFDADDAPTWVAPYRFSLKFGKKEVASRKQIPLTLAYAITIHKAQGKTIDAAHIDISRVFENGQAYTALSRMSSIDQLSFARPVTLSKLNRVSALAATFYDTPSKEAQEAYDLLGEISDFEG